jgi:CII-binding regulator of phage lambda lysogenization HflD
MISASIEKRSIVEFAEVFGPDRNSLVVGLELLLELLVWENHLEGGRNRGSF